MERKGTCLVGETGDIVRPEVFRSDWMAWKNFEEEVLEEAHVLEAEKGDLVLGLVTVSSVSVYPEILPT